MRPAQMKRDREHLCYWDPGHQQAHEPEELGDIP